MAQITNKGRRWIQHGDNHIVLSNNPSITNFQITATIHLPVLATGDRTTRGPQHSSPTPPIAPRFSAGSMLSITTRATTRLDGIGGTFFTALIRLNGGFGFTSGGYDGVNPVGTVERFDDVANSQTARTSTVTRNECAGFSLNGFGHVVGGENPIGSVVGAHTMLDDVLNTQVVRDIIISRSGLTAYTINGFGFTSCGFNGTTRVGTTERFDGVANANTTRTSATARDLLAGFGMNNFGFTACGETAGPTTSNINQRFDDIANTQTSRASLVDIGACAGFSLNGFGYVFGGESPVGNNNNTVTTFDDIANSPNTIGIGTARRLLSAFSLNGFGFSSGGFVAAVSAVTERYDNVATTITGVVNLNTARSGLAGFATNEYFTNYDTMEP